MTDHLGAVVLPSAVTHGAVSTGTFDDGRYHRPDGSKKLSFKKRTGRATLVAAVLFAMLPLTAHRAVTALASGPTPPFIECPAVGFDTGCAILIVINPDGTTNVYQDTNQIPFDGVEDTLVGVLNNSAVTINSIPLQGTDPNIDPIFGFDVDGLCSGLQQGPGPVGSTFAPPPSGCPFGPTGYEGPNTSFTVNNDGTFNDGSVDFPAGLAPGATTYFSLEGDVSAGTIAVAPPPPPPSADQPITAQGTTFSATEGQQVSGMIATFTDPDTTAAAGDYSATIDWGDGSPSSAGTVSGGGGTFTVSDSHTYAEEGTYTVTVTINDVTDDPSNTATATSTANVSDAALAAAPACPAASSPSFNGATATFTDANPSGTLSDFSATIDWGDGSSSAGAVSGPDGGPYTVSGSHTYASTGYVTISTTITDVGGSSTSTSCKTLVYAFAPGGGYFVIGNNNAAVGTSVTFWGAQWWKLNSLSGGAAPASFEGYAESPATPSRGTSWSTDPGNSPPPPAGSLPAYMGVIVTSAATQSGSTISGNTVHIVVVKTNSGYQPDPGHPGTGTVVAQVG